MAAELAWLCSLQLLFPLSSLLARKNLEELRSISVAFVTVETKDK